MFNTLKYSKILEATGVSREQAEAHIQIIAEIVEDDLATKQDIREIKNELNQLENRLIVKLTAILIPSTALTFAIIAALMKHF